MWPMKLSFSKRLINNYLHYCWNTFTSLSFHSCSSVPPAGSTQQARSEQRWHRKKWSSRVSVRWANAPPLTTLYIPFWKLIHIFEPLAHSTRDFPGSRRPQIVKFLCGYLYEQNHRCSERNHYVMGWAKTEEPRVKTKWSRGVKHCRDDGGRAGSHAIEIIISAQPAVMRGMRHACTICTVIIMYFKQ